MVAVEEIQAIDNYKPNPLSHFERKRTVYKKIWNA